MEIEKVIKNSVPMNLPVKTVINLMYTTRVLEEAMATTLKEFDLTTQQFNVLRILRGQKGNPASLSCIQERMVDKNSNTTRLVDKLIVKSFAERRICPHNRRQVEIIITEQGLTLLKKLDPVTESLNKELLHNLSDAELEQLNNLLNKLRNDD
ncbi:MAG: MarR family transcriptional regulator [Leeuwenhoekiella sp.]